MFVYSVRVTIKKEIEKEWSDWMNNVHINDVIQTGFFTRAEFQKLIIPNNSELESTYQINYSFDSIDSYQKYLETEAPRLQNGHSEKFPNKFKISRAVYQIISK